MRRQESLRVFEQQATTATLDMFRHMCCLLMSSHCIKKSVLPRFGAAFLGGNLSLRRCRWECTASKRSIVPVRAPSKSIKKKKRASKNCSFGNCPWTQLLILHCTPEVLTKRCAMTHLHTSNDHLQCKAREGCLHQFNGLRFPLLPPSLRVFLPFLR